ncbi:hypothetical protein ACIOUE_07165 [Streptomyces xanthochromogenes]|uniref:hypothetical protein n=1 Tax=Streptomyces xanthochromogenes TaxID=67384 RepID=UPI003449AA0F
MPLRLVVHDPAALRARCSTGRVRTSRTEPGYEPGAVLTPTRWQPLSARAAERLRADDADADSTLVEIVRPPAGAELDTLADPLGDPESVYLGQVSARPGLATTTDNHEVGLRIGLHLDNWDKLSYARKHTGRRRLCLNLGPGPRYVVLGAVDAQLICRALHTDYARRYPHTDDLRAYAARWDMSCIRIRLAPGEGYIAPTEYLPHDGSTDGVAVPSTAAFWLGDWSRGVLPSLI